MMGVTFAAKDADYLIDTIIRSTAPGYVTPFQRSKGERTKAISDTGDA